MTSNRQLCGQEKGSHAEGAAGANAIRLGRIGISYRERANSMARTHGRERRELERGWLSATL